MFQNYPFSTGQATLNGTTSQIVPANHDRSGLVITNQSSVPVYIVENANGTTATGHLLPGTVGASLGFTTTGAVFGVTGGSTATITWLQTQ